MSVLFFHFWITTDYALKKYYTIINQGNSSGRISSDMNKFLKLNNKFPSLKEHKPKSLILFLY